MLYRQADWRSGVVRYVTKTDQHNKKTYRISYVDFELAPNKLSCIVITSTNKLTRWSSWLRHCATRREVAGSIPDGVTVMFHWRNPSGYTVALELT